MAAADVDIRAEEERGLKERENYTDEEWYNKILDDLNNWKKQRINIGVVGGAKQGKSSLVSALLGFEFDDKGELPPGAAKVDGAGVCTRDATPYIWPGKENVVFWDLPGVDGSNHTIEKYLEIIGADHPEVDPSKRKRIYDLFLIVVSDVIGTSAKFLVSKAQELEIKFYIVRTQIDLSIYKCKKQRKSAEAVKYQVRVDLIEQMTEMFGLHLDNNYKIFLVDNYSKSEHDFEDLQIAILEDGPREKRKVLIRCVEATGSKPIDAKFKVLKDRVSTVARSCALSAGVPFVGFFARKSGALILAEILEYFKMFQLFIKDVESFETKNRLQRRSLENIVQKKLYKESPELSKIRNEAKDLSSFNQNDLLEKAFTILSTAAVGTTTVGAAVQVASAAAIRATVATEMEGVTGAASMVGAAGVTAAGGAIATAGVSVLFGVMGYYKASKELDKKLRILRKLAIATHQKAWDLRKGLMM